MAIRRRGALPIVTGAAALAYRWLAGVVRSEMRPAQPGSAA